MKLLDIKQINEEDDGLQTKMTTVTGEDGKKQWPVKLYSHDGKVWDSSKKVVLAKKEASKPK